MLLELTRFWFAFFIAANAHPAVQARPGSDKNVIRRHVRAELPRVERCYQLDLPARPDLAGTATATFTIAPTGQVTSVHVVGMGLEVDACIESIFRGMRFPAPENDGTVNVTYPFTFRPH
jgi:hypothetical protein